MSRLDGWALVLAVLAAGCTLPRGTLLPARGRDASVERDATAPLDGTAPPDATLGLDAGAPDDASGADAFSPVDDGGGPRDAFVPPDSGNDGGCTGPTRCEGNVLVGCAGGTPTRLDCAATGAVCEAGACMMLCAPGTTRCSGTIQDLCDTTGRWIAAASCPLGCTGTTCTPVPPTCTAFTAAGSIAVGGMVDLDLCGGTRMSVGTTSTCSGATGRELMLTLDVMTTGTVTLDLRDRDGDTAVDTVLYVRTTCDVASSQVACDDDEACDPGDGIDDPCVRQGDGSYRQYGHSRVSRELVAGRYYVFVDSIAASSTVSRCGMVRLTATSP